MKWIDSRVENEVKQELENLTTVLEIISQLPIDEAKRILLYCLSYVESSKNPKLLPKVETEISEALKEFKVWMQSRTKAKEDE